jgi:hypothetical protein
LNLLEWILSLFFMKVSWLKSKDILDKIKP